MRGWQALQRRPQAAETHLGVGAGRFHTAALQATDQEIRRSATWALGELGNPTPEVRTGLRGALQDRAAAVRSSAARALGKLGDSRAPAPAELLAALQAAEEWLRDSAAGAASGPR